MRFPIVSITLFLLLNVPSLQAQVASQQALIKPTLKVGDELPDISYDSVLNHTTSTIRLSDFKGKILLLDFWATWCSPCIAAFPKLEALQKKFADQLQILPVTRESYSVVKNFMGKMQKVKQINPISVTGDQLLNAYFPHQYIPHYVWINRDGKVIAITEENQVNEQSIKNAIENNSVELRLKDDVPAQYITDPEKPFFVTALKIREGNSFNLKPLSDSDIVKHSIITRYVDGIIPGISMEVPNLVFAQNLSVKSLYHYAFWGNSIIGLNRSNVLTAIEIDDPDTYQYIQTRRKDGTKFVQPGAATTAWQKQFAFCYELQVPDFLIADRFNIMLRELNAFFGPLYNIEGVKEKRKIKYLSLYRIGSLDSLKTKGGDRSEKADNRYSISLRNQSLGSLIAALAYPLQTLPPIIDETGYTEKVDMDLNCQLSDLEQLNKELNKYGLRLAEKQMIKEIGVVRTRGKRK